MVVVEVSQGKSLNLLRTVFLFLSNKQATGPPISPSLEVAPDKKA